MESPESAPTPKDIGQEFVSMSHAEFRDLLQGLRAERFLVLNADLSHISDQSEFKAKARQVKAFVETLSDTQKRSASIKATKEQVIWEPNVFSSNVALIEV